MTTKRQPFSPLSDLLGTAIADVDGAVVGHVTEFLVDEHDGRVAYVQIRLCQDRSEPVHRVTVPYSSIRAPGHSDAMWQLRVGKSTLRALTHSD